MALTIVVASHNEGKLAEIRRILAEDLAGAPIELVSAGSLGLPDPVETGVTFQENALLKARFVAQRSGMPAIADDSGLIVDVMGAAPGILSARWAGEHGNDAANNELLLKQIADIPDDKRTARFRCAAALAVPGPGADAEGLHPPAQASGGPELTSAEMSADEKNAISHRGKALKALVPAIAQLVTR